MPSLFTIPEIIQIAKVSQYLADDKASKGALFGDVINPQLGLILYTIRKDVEDLYELDPTGSYTAYNLFAMADYLYGLCEDALTAQAIISGGGGSVVPPIDPNRYVWYSFVGTVDAGQDNSNTYHNDIFIGALELNTFTVNSGSLQTDPPNFTFDSDAGTIDWTPNTFFTGDVIAAQFYRKI